MKVRRYALDPMLGSLIGCPDHCSRDARVEVMESQDYKGIYEGVEMKCANCGAETKYYRKPVLLSFEFNYA